MRRGKNVCGGKKERGNNGVRCETGIRFDEIRGENNGITKRRRAAKKQIGIKKYHIHKREQWEENDKGIKREK